MNYPIKTEFNPDYCISCLKTDTQTLRDDQIEKDLVLMLNDLLKNYVDSFEGIPMIMCLDCVKLLKKMHDFRKKCIDSIEYYRNSVSNEMKSPEENLSILDACQPIIKEEDGTILVFASELDVDPDENDKKSIMKSVMKRKIGEKNPAITKEKRVKTIFKAQSSKRTKKTKPEPSPLIPKKSETRYCPICCYKQPGIHRHTLELHARQISDHLIGCIYCDETFPNIDKILTHLETNHKMFQQTRKCIKCDFETKVRSEFLQHIHMTHYESKPKINVCDFCDYVSPNRIYYFRCHVWTHIGAVRCKHCEVSFFDKDELETHMSSHYVKPKRENLICDLCGHVSALKTHMREHMLINHIQGQELECEFCHKKIKTLVRLKSHVIHMHTPKTFQCPLCGKKYATKGQLRFHTRIIHNQEKYRKKIPETRDFACDQCDKRFFTKAMLQKHTHSHTKTRPYNCHLCPTGYYMNMYLRNHYHRVHGLVYTKNEVTRLCGRKPIGGDSD